MKPGDLVDNRFEIQALLGTGGMGAVFRALDRTTHQKVALKTLHDPGGNHIERFMREAQVLKELNHPNIVGYVADGKSPKGEWYIAMEWIDGPSLSEHIADSNAFKSTQRLTQRYSVGIANRSTISESKCCPDSVSKCISKRISKCISKW